MWLDEVMETRRCLIGDCERRESVGEVWPDVLKEMWRA